MNSYEVCGDELIETDTPAAVRAYLARQQRTVSAKRVTARKYMGNDAGSWAVFIDGRPMVTGLTKSEVPYYRAQAEKRIAQKEQS